MSNAKLAKMRTAWDVINRLQHDPVFRSGKSIYIGYIDFGCLVEKPFKAFSNWGNIENASLHDLAIPQHRVRYFRHEEGGMLWNKEERLDLIFGSTEPFKTVDYAELEEKARVGRELKEVGEETTCHTPLQTFLRAHNLTAFADIRNVLTSTGFGCKVKRGVGVHSNLFLVMYSDQRYFTSQSDLRVRGLSAGNPSACLDHCRGVIYEINTNKLVCSAYDKFWESYDPRSAINIINWTPNQVKVHEKCDGSLTKVFYYKNRWHIASNGCINADRAGIPGSTPPTTVGKLFRQAALSHFDDGWEEMCSELNKKHTYSFELCHPSSRIVVYHSRPKLIHLNTRVQATGVEIVSEVTNIGKPTAIEPRSGPRHSLEDLQSLANRLPSQCEGFVVTDSENNRIKIKGKEYLRAHGDLTGLNTNVWYHILSGWIFENDVVEGLSPLTWKELLPREWRNRVEEVERWFISSLEEIAGTRDGRALLRREAGRKGGGAGRKLLNELFESEVQKVQRPKDGSRPNFFVCIKIDDPEIVKNVQGFQEFLVACDPDLASSIQPISSLHITLTTFLCPSKKELAVALDALKLKLPEVLASALPAEHRIQIKGTAAFSTTSEVIYASTSSTKRIQFLCSRISDILIEAGIQTPGNRTNVVPHVTINRLSRSQIRSGRVDESLWRPTHGDCLYGDQSCRFGVQVCSIVRPANTDSSFYSVAATILPSAGGASLQSDLASVIRKFEVVILRGLPGAGKSTLIEQAKKELFVEDVDFYVASADNYFEASGEYLFDRAMLGKAHEYSCSVAGVAMEENRTVVIDNTSVTESEVAVYIKMAKKRGKVTAVFDLCSNSVADAIKLKNKHGVEGTIPPPGDINYYGLFLTEEAKQRMMRLNARVSEMGSEGDDVVIKCDHVTLAHHTKMGGANSKLASMIGRKVKINLDGVASDDFTTVCKVSVEDMDVAKVAKLSGQSLHLTLSHDKAVKAARSNDILSSTRPFFGKSIEGVLGYYSKRSKKPIFEIGGGSVGFDRRLDLNLSGVNSPCFVFDCDRTLLMTPSRDDFERVKGRSWRGGSFYDSKLSLSPDLPMSAGPAMKTLQRLKRQWGSAAKFVLLTGRIEGLEREVLSALARFDVLKFDAVFLRPREKVTATWKAEIVGQLSKQFGSIVCFDDDAQHRQGYWGGGEEDWTATGAVEELLVGVTGKLQYNLYEHGSSLYGRVSDVDLTLEVDGGVLADIADGIAENARRNGKEKVYVVNSDVNSTVKIGELIGGVDFDIVVVNRVVPPVLNPSQRVLATLQRCGCDVEGFTKALNPLIFGLERRGVTGAPFLHVLQTYEIATGLANLIAEEGVGRDFDFKTVTVLRAYLEGVKNGTVGLPGKIGHSIRSLWAGMLRNALDNVLGAIEGAGITEKKARLAMSVFPPRNLSFQTVVRIKCAGFETLEFMKGRLLHRITKLVREQNLFITSGMNSAQP
ncbi:hypothetical protein TL16_g03873 [Triparma laevis f. inornata]|uniref:2',3'-cyclic-nucleotide 3'-phosphodiesterase n=1 Tax=Triparma laevis f. inornata TaxID=1714386 RepID=A0A9W7A7F5_9STRA|nr:hypothetical protein TL16_g03873 [Triparma laevis f. inornata]